MSCLLIVASTPYYSIAAIALLVVIGRYFWRRAQGEAAKKIDASFSEVVMGVIELAIIVLVLVALTAACF
jgi:hypothetical protein